MWVSSLRSVGLPDSGAWGSPLRNVGLLPQECDPLLSGVWASPLRRVGLSSQEGGLPPLEVWASDLRKIGLPRQERLQPTLNLWVQAQFWVKGEKRSALGVDGKGQCSLEHWARPDTGGRDWVSLLRKALRRTN